MHGKTRVLFRHPKGRFDVIERCGVGALGRDYCIRETVLTPERDSRGQLTDADLQAPPIAFAIHPTAQEEPKKRTSGRKHLTEPEKRKICTMWRQGWSIGQISAAVGCSSAAVRRALDEKGVREIEKRRPWTQEETALAVQLWREGISQRMIAERLGRKRSTVARQLQSMARQM